MHKGAHKRVVLSIRGNGCSDGRLWGGSQDCGHRNTLDRRRVGERREEIGGRFLPRGPLRQGFGARGGGSDRDPFWNRESSADSELIGAARRARPLDRIAWLLRGAHTERPERLRQHVGQTAAAGRERTVLQDRSQVEPIARSRERDIHQALGLLSLAEALLLVAL